MFGHTYITGSLYACVIVLLLFIDPNLHIQYWIKSKQPFLSKILIYIHVYWHTIVNIKILKFNLFFLCFVVLACEKNVFDDDTVLFCIYRCVSMHKIRYL